MSQNVGLKPKKKIAGGGTVSYVRYITMLAMLTALGVAVKSLSVYLSATTKVSFVFIVESITAVALGPVATVIQACVTDVIGIIIFPADGGFLPQFTLSAVAAGALTGIFLSKKVTLPRIIMARVSVNVLVYMLLNSVWMEQIYKMPFKVRLLAQLIKCPILCAAEIVILTLVLPVTAKALRQFGFKIEVSDNVNIGSIKSGVKSNILPFAGTVAAGVAMLMLKFDTVTLSMGGRTERYSYYGLVTDKLFAVDKKATFEMAQQYKYLLIIPIVLAASSAIVSLFAGKWVKYSFGVLTVASFIVAEKVFMPLAFGTQVSIVSDHSAEGWIFKIAMVAYLLIANDKIFFVPQAKEEMNKTDE